jgi:hypothetical protein
VTGLVPSPPLAPELPGPAMSEQIDAVIRMAWQLQQRREMSWDAAGEIHHALIEVRDGGLR